MSVLAPLAVQRTDNVIPVSSRLSATGDCLHIVLSSTGPLLYNGLFPTTHSTRLVLKKTSCNHSFFSPFIRRTRTASSVFNFSFTICTKHTSAFHLFFSSVITHFSSLPLFFFSFFVHFAHQLALSLNHLFLADPSLVCFPLLPAVKVISPKTFLS